MNFDNISNDELLQYKQQVENKKAKYKILQLAKKVQLNSAYGSLGNNYSRFYDIRLAEAITLSGQLAIKWIEKDLNKFLNGYCGTDGFDFVVASDTDSCVGETIIDVNGKKDTIEKIYQLAGEEIHNTNTGQHIKKMCGLTPCVNSKGELEYKKIKYIMKHKVKKNFFNIRFSEGSVVVTEDHSVIVNDVLGQIVERKPANIQKTDQIISIANDTDSIGCGKEKM